jgi:hypothetical protein
MRKQQTLQVHILHSATAQSARSQLRVLTKLGEMTTRRSPTQRGATGLAEDGRTPSTGHRPTVAIYSIYPNQSPTRPQPISSVELFVVGKGAQLEDRRTSITPKPLLCFFFDLQSECPLRGDGLLCKCVFSSLRWLSSVFLAKQGTTSVGPLRFPETAASRDFAGDESEQRESVEKRVPPPPAVSARALHANQPSFFCIQVLHPSFAWKQASTMLTAFGPGPETLPTSSTAARAPARAPFSNFSSLEADDRMPSGEA